MATGSTSWVPDRTWTTTCQNEAYTTSSSLERRSVPNSSTASGIRATEGMGRRNSMVEAVAARRAGTLPISRPSPTPAATATATRWPSPPGCHPALSRTTAAGARRPGRRRSGWSGAGTARAPGRPAAPPPPAPGSRPARPRPATTAASGRPSREQGGDVRLLGDQAVLDGQGGQRLHRGPVDLGRPLGQGQLLDDGLVDLGVTGEHL